MTDRRLAGQLALVNGAGKGIDQAIASSSLYGATWPAAGIAVEAITELHRFGPGECAPCPWKIP